MFKMIEVVGRHADGYSEAIRAAVDKLLADGHKVHFFTVIEQRGAIRSNRLAEFQAVIKVAIEE